MPRAPKPRALRANHERRDVGLISSAPRQLNTPIPTPPTGMLRESRETWTQLWESPIAQIIVPATDLPALRRLWTLYDQRARAFRGFQKAPLVAGSMGQPKASPLFSILTALDAEIRQLEDRFGLSPKARLTLGVILGDAARSLDDLSATFTDDDDDDEDDDPRLLVVPAVERNAG